MFYGIAELKHAQVRYSFGWLLHVIPCLIIWWVLSAFDASSNSVLILFVIFGIASVCAKMEVYYERWCESQVDNQNK